MQVLIWKYFLLRKILKFYSGGNMIKSYTNQLYVLNSFYLHLFHLSLDQATIIPSLIYWNNLLTNLSKSTFAPFWSLTNTAHWTTFAKNRFDLKVLFLDHTLPSITLSIKTCRALRVLAPAHIFSFLSSVALSFFPLFLYVRPHPQWAFFMLFLFGALFSPLLVLPFTPHPSKDRFLVYSLSLSIRSDLLWGSVSSHTFSSIELSTKDYHAVIRTCTKQMHVSLVWHLMEKVMHVLE